MPRRLSTRRAQPSALRRCRSLGFGWLALCFLLTPGPGTISAEPASSAKDQRSPAPPARIYVDFHAKTWFPRGFLFTDIEAMIRNKVQAAGLSLTRDRSEPHDYVLAVAYREEPGREYRVQNYGTVIHCELRLTDRQQTSLFDVAFEESSDYVESGTPPYLEALEKFQANPYFYFLGDLLKGRIVAGLNVQDALVEGLRRSVTHPPKSEDPLDAHNMQSFDEFHFLWAWENAVKELARLKAPRAIPVMISMLGHRDPKVRVMAVTGLETIGVKEAVQPIEEIARHDPAADVCARAETALRLLSRPVSPGP